LVIGVKVLIGNDCLRKAVIVKIAQRVLAAEFGLGAETEHRDVRIVVAVVAGVDAIAIVGVVRDDDVHASVAVEITRRNAVGRAAVDLLGVG
jgi:hypothetical protein